MGASNLFSRAYPQNVGVCLRHMPTHLYPHLEKPQLRQMTQPPSCSTGPPHSGQIYLRRRGEAHLAAGGPAVAGRRPPRGATWAWAPPQDAGQRCCFTDETVHFGQNLSDGVRAGGAAHALLADCGRAADALELVAHFLHADATAQRHAGRRAVASLWLGQPPALPVLVNTSQMPFSS